MLKLVRPECDVNLNAREASPATTGRVRGFKSAVTFFAVGSCILMSGCGPSALEFNEKIVNGNIRLKQANDVIANSLRNAMQTGDTKQAKADLDNLKKSLSSIQTEMKEWKVPSAQSAKNLHQGYEKFLKAHEEIIGHYQKLITLAEDRNMDPGEKNRQIQAIDKAIDTADLAQTNQLKNLQSAFAKDHNLILK